MRFSPTKYKLMNVATGRVFDDEGWTLSDPHGGPASLLRAVYEGIVFSHMTHVKRLLRNRKAPEAIRLAGGAANSKVWVQIFADALQSQKGEIFILLQAVQGLMLHNAVSQQLILGDTFFFHS